MKTLLWLESHVRLTGTSRKMGDLEFAAVLCRPLASCVACSGALDVTAQAARLQPEAPDSSRSTQPAAGPPRLLQQWIPTLSGLAFGASWLSSDHPSAGSACLFSHVVILWTTMKLLANSFPPFLGTSLLLHLDHIDSSPSWCLLFFRSWLCAKALDMHNFNLPNNPIHPYSRC